MTALAGLPPLHERRRDALVAAILPSLRRVARANTSGRDDDADEAVARTLLIVARRPDIQAQVPEKAARWAVTVVRHEAWRVARERRDVARHGVLDEDIAAPGDAYDVVEERLDVFEGLGRLKRDEARALLARASGLTYHEIEQEFGWTYTKTNRSLTEGRAALRRTRTGARAATRLAAAA